MSETINQPEKHFTDNVGELERALPETEEFVQAVAEALDDVKSYADREIMAGKQLPPEHAEMAYEHGLTLFRRELPDNLTLPFARQARAEMQKIDPETGRPLYEDDYTKAFENRFGYELNEMELPEDEFDKEIGRLLLEKGDDVYRPREAHEETSSDPTNDLESKEVSESVPQAIELTDEQAVALREQWLKDFSQMTPEQLRSGSWRLPAEPGLSDDEIESYRNSVIDEYAEMPLGQFKLRAEFLLDNARDKGVKVSEEPDLTLKWPEISASEKVLDDIIEEAREGIIQAQSELEVAKHEYERAVKSHQDRPFIDRVAMLGGVGNTDISTARYLLEMAKKRLEQAEDHYQYLLDRLDRRGA